MTVAKVLTRRLERVPRGLLAALDPLVSSGTMFVVQFAILLTSMKTEYGLFSLVMSYVVMGQATSSAVFGAPLITLLSGLDPQTQARGVRSVLRLCLRAGLATVLIGMAMCGATLGASHLGTALLAPIALAGFVFRDLQRIVWAVEGRLPHALINSCLFSGFTIAAVAVAWLIVGHIDPAIGYGALVFALLCANGGGMIAALRERATLPVEVGLGLRKLVVWSFPGAIVVWVQNNLYLSIVALMLGLGMAGEVAAGRLVAVPYLLATSGVLRVMQVRFVRLRSTGSGDRIDRSLWLWTIGNAAAGMLCYGIAVAAGPYLSAHGLTPVKYPHLVELSGAWLLFAFLSALRGGWSALLQSRHLYREIFVANLTVLPVVVGGIVLLVPRLGLNGAILPMIVGEVQLFVLCAVIARLTRNRNLVQRDDTLEAKTHG